MNKRNLRVIVLPIAVLVICNFGLFLSGCRFYIGQNVTDGWIVEGDLLYSEWRPELTRYKDKVPAKFTDCKYWSGVRVKHYPLPSTEYPEGCPTWLPMSR